jgi:arylsulfatase A-like enzyme
MVLNLDVASTIVDLAGVPAPREFQGRSWIPLIAGKATSWREAFFYEYYLEAAYPTTPTVLAVRTPTAKLITYPGHGDWTELFDLKNDPYELKNLARDPARAALLAEMTATFAREQAAAGPPLPSR